MLKLKWKKAAVWNSAPFLPNIFKIKVLEYYKDVKVKFKVQLCANKLFTDAILFPGIYPDYGTVVEASAFGCEIVWFKNEAPFVKGCIKNFDDISKINLPNPEKDGLMPIVLEEYKYMWENINSKLIKEKGYLDGMGYSLGPLEVSAFLMGYENFFLGMYLNPKKILELIKKVKETILKWIESQQKINGKIKRLFIVDHTPSELSKEFFLKFGFKALKDIFAEYPDALKVWHNEGKVMHIKEYLDEMGFNIFHCGDDIIELQKITKNIIFMGNLSPINLMLKNNPTEIEKEVKNILNSVPDKKRLIISTAGGMAPGTPINNIITLIDTVNKYYKNNN